MLDLDRLNKKTRMVWINIPIKDLRFVSIDFYSFSVLVVFNPCQLSIVTYFQLKCSEQQVWELGSKFDLHPLTVEDILHKGFKLKYGNG
jgi:hypothetical protein